MGRDGNKLVTQHICSLPGCHNQFNHIKQFATSQDELVEYEPTEAYTCIVVLQYVDASGYQFYQCDQGDFIDGHTWQHWHCSADHRLQGVTRCIHQDMTEDKLHHIPIGGGTTNLHTMVLREANNPGLHCVLCNQPITTKAYRIAIMTSTPDWVTLGNAHTDELGDWCDTLEHAKTYALQLLRDYEKGH